MLFVNKIKNFTNTKKILSEKEFKINISKGFRYEVSKNKLKHDIEQISYLLKKKLVSKKFNNIIKKYKFIYSSLPKNSDPTDIFTLSKEFTYKLGPTFNNLIYYQPPDIIEKKIINDNKKIVEENSKKKFKYIVIDDFLNKEVLNKLYAYCLTNSIWNEFDYKKGDTEGFVNYALSINKCVLAAIFIEDEKNKIIKISLRSKGDFSVNELSRKHFEGGGHNNAAGGKSNDSLEKTIERFISILPEYKTALQNEV